jgi:hypothetical protein
MHLEHMLAQISTTKCCLIMSNALDEASVLLHHRFGNKKVFLLLVCLELHNLAFYQVFYLMLPTLYFHENKFVMDIWCFD